MVTHCIALFQSKMSVNVFKEEIEFLKEAKIGTELVFMLHEMNKQLILRCTSSTVA